MATQQKNEVTGVGFLAGLLVGTLVGAALATLFAPQPGVETREMLARQSRSLREKMETMAGDMQEGLGELTTRIRKSPAQPQEGEASARQEEAGS